jgi:hypothetical protein
LHLVFAWVSDGFAAPILANSAAMQNTPSSATMAVVASVAPTRSVAPVPVAPGDAAPPPGEIGGPAGPEPTRYGDWEKNGRCIDF